MLVYHVLVHLCKMNCTLGESDTSLRLGMTYWSGAQSSALQEHGRII